MIRCVLVVCLALLPGLVNGAVRRISADFEYPATKREVTSGSRDRHLAVMRVPAGIDLRLFRADQAFHEKRYRYHQYHRGVRVEGVDISVWETAGGALASGSGSWVNGLAEALPTVHYRINEAAATTIALNHLTGGRPGDFDQMGFRIEKVILIEPTGPVLAYKIGSSLLNRATRRPLSTDLFMTSEGRVLRVDDVLKRVAATGPGGNRRTGKYEYGVQFPALDVTKVGTRCQMSNIVVQTIDASRDINSITPHSFKCSRNTYKTVNGAYSPINDAHFLVGRASSLVWNTTQLNLAAGKRIHAKVHAEVPDYAYYDPRFVDPTLVFTDGDVKWYPATVPDIVGHEAAHLFVATHGKLRLDRISMILDEAYADLAGEALEESLSGRSNYIVAAQVEKAGRGFRYFETPSLDGKSIDHFNELTDAKSAYEAGGMYRRAFFVLSNTPGWGLFKTYRLASRAVIKHWDAVNTAITFQSSVCGLEQAARDLGYSDLDVRAAFREVGLRCGAVWDRVTARGGTAVGGAMGPAPVFSNGDATISSGSEPPDGFFGFFANADVSYASGRRYFEVKIERQRPGQLYPYSGGLAVGLASVGKPPLASSILMRPWHLLWITDPETQPNSYPCPWFYGPRYPLTCYMNPTWPLAAWVIGEGSVIGFAIDLDAGKIWMSLNGQWATDPVQGEPVVDQARDQIVHPMAGENLAPWAFADITDFSITLLTTPDELNQPPPPGFLAWN